MLLRTALFLVFLELFITDVELIDNCRYRRRRYAGCCSDLYDPDRCTVCFYHCSSGYSCISDICIPVKTYGQSCSSTEECQRGLTCDGTCECSPEEHYKDGTCQTKQSFGGTCSDNSQCLTNLLCINSRCGCAATQFLDGNNLCKARLQYMAPCTLSSQCEQTLSCINSTCVCSSTQFYDNNQLICTPRLQYMAPCTLSSQCEQTLTCINSTCVCSSTQFYEINQLICTPRLQYIAPCTLSSQCEQTLACINSTCVCSSTQFYDNNQLICTPRKTYGEFCLFTGECQASMTCDGYCKCLDYQYFDGTCFTRLHLGRTCSSDSQCVEPLTCDNGRCNCWSDRRRNFKVTCQTGLKPKKEKTLELYRSCSSNGRKKTSSSGLHVDTKRQK